jgi:hypothetical protein
MNMEEVEGAICRIEENIRQGEDLETVYKTFVNLIKNEMECKLKTKCSTKHVLKNGDKFGKHKKHYKPYWNTELQDLWNEVCSREKKYIHCKHSVGKSKLKSDYCNARYTFNKTLRKYKRKYQVQEISYLNNLCKTDPNEMWKYIGKIGISEGRKSVIPMEVKVGEDIVSDEKQVLDVWKTEFEKLYNEEASPDFDADHLSVIKQNVKKVSSVPGPDALNKPIELHEVKDAIQRMKVRKAAGIDEIPIEVLKNDQCIRILYTICNQCFATGSIPSDWKKGIINPIPKGNDKDPRVPSSYRGITLINVPCKVYCDILNVRMTNWLEQQNVIVDEQNGYQKKRSVLDHLISLYNVLNNRKNAKLSTYTCYIDLRKAFDNVNRDCLWFKILQHGIEGKMYNAIRSIYDDVKCAVRINGRMTQWFSVNNGVKQGCKMSPVLFQLYINDLATNIKALNCGVQIADRNLSILLFADDIVLLAGNANDLQRMLDVVHDWCCKWRLCINEEKTKIVHYRPPSMIQNDVKFKCGTFEVPYVTSYKYLGLWLDQFLDLKTAVKEIAKSASRALGVLICKSKAVGGMSYNVFTKLFNSLVTPILMYGAGIWGTINRNVINTVQNRAGRYFLGVGKFAANSATQGDIGWTSCLNKQKTEVVRLWCRLNTLNPDRITRKIFDWSSGLARSGKTNWVKRCKGIFNELEIHSMYEVNGLLDKAKSALHKADQEQWYRSLWNDVGNENGNKLRLYRLFKERLEPDSYVTSNIPQSYKRVLAKLRTGSLPLEIELGRFNKPKTLLNDRICKLCDLNVVESEIHFLTKCPLYDDLRYNLFSKMDSNDPEFLNMPLLVKTCAIFNCNYQYELSKMVYLMFQRRKIFYER